MFNLKSSLISKAFFTRHSVLEPLTHSRTDLTISRDSLILNHVLTVEYNLFCLMSSLLNLLFYVIFQTNTDEDVALPSGQMYPYSWHTMQSQTLQICLDCVGDWKWSEPISIDTEGIISVTLEHKSFASQLFVEVKLIGGIQKQVCDNSLYDRPHVICTIL